MNGRDGEGILLLPLLTAGFGRTAPLLSVVVRDCLPDTTSDRQQRADRLISRLLDATTEPDFVGAVAWTADGIAVGLAAVCTGDGAGELHLGVHPAWRRCGIGGALHDLVLTEARGPLHTRLGGIDAAVVDWYTRRGWWTIDPGLAGRRLAHFGAATA